MAKKLVAAEAPATDDIDMFVCFGDRALSFKVEDLERENLQGHALTLSMALHVMQRVVTRFDFDEAEGFSDADANHVHVGLDFLSGVVSEFLLEAGT